MKMIVWPSELEDYRCRRLLQSLMIQYSSNNIWWCCPFVNIRASLPVCCSSLGEVQVLEPVVALLFCQQYRISSLQVRFRPSLMAAGKLAMPALLHFGSACSRSVCIDGNPISPEVWLNAAPTTAASTNHVIDTNRDGVMPPTLPNRHCPLYPMIASFA